MSNVPSQGWAVQVTHPTTSRTITPQVLSRPQLLPSLNSLPEIRIPVKPSAAWLDDGFDDNPTMDVWLDGDKQPIDELRRVEDEQGQTVLVGVGGVELRQRVEAEYRSEERHVAARELVDNNTTYGTDVDTPTFTTLQDQSQQNPTTTTDFNTVISPADDEPIDTSGDEVTIFQTCFIREGEDVDSASGTGSYFGSDVSGDTSPDPGEGEAEEFNDSGQQATWDFTPNNDIPADDVAVYIRDELNNSPELEMTLDGTTWTIVSGGGTDSGYDWQDYAGNPLSASNGYVDEGGGDLSANTTYTVQIDSVTSGGSTPFARIDLVAPLDALTRFTGGADATSAYTFDNTLTTGGDDGRYLDTPGTHPDGFDVEGRDATTAFRYTEATGTVSQSDTTDDQRLQLSGDSGGTWQPSNGDEDNTTSVTVDFSSSPTATMRLRVRLSSFSPNGTRDQTPRENYDAQTVTDWEITADVQEQRLLVDQTFDSALVSILNDIAGELEDYVWSYNLDSNGNAQVSWTQPGSRTAASDPDFSDITIEKDTDTWPKITIKGSNKGISEETFTASSSFVDLTESNIVPNSETVYDPTTSPTTQFDRDSDYQMDYSDGQIKTTNGSAMTDGNDFQIDYDAEVRGTYTDSGAGMNPDERVESVPAVNSASGAEQVAWSLVQDFKDPRWSGNAVIPQTDAQFDPLDALPLADLQLPSAATPLEISGSPRQTPEGLEYRLGSDTELSQALSAIGGQLRSVSKRV